MKSGPLTNELRVASYGIQVTIYCTSYKFFLHELPVTIYCKSCELLFWIPVTSFYLLHEFQVTFKDDLRVTIYCTTYGLNLSYELRVTIARVGIAILIVSLLYQLLSNEHMTQ